MDPRGESILRGRVERDFALFNELEGRDLSSIIIN
jgi:hypothetical protein